MREVQLNAVSRGELLPVGKGQVWVHSRNELLVFCTVTVLVLAKAVLVSTVLVYPLSCLLYCYSVSVSKGCLSVHCLGVSTQLSSVLLQC